MSGPLESVTGALLSKALDMSLMTHQAIASNVANASTAGYQPVKIDFDSVLNAARNAVESGNSKDEIIDRLKQLTIEPEYETLSTSVQIDRQMVWMAKNTTHSQALVGARSELGSLMKMAINGGRG